MQKRKPRREGEHPYLVPAHCRRSTGKASWTRGPTLAPRPVVESVRKTHLSSSRSRLVQLPPQQRVPEHGSDGRTDEQLSRLAMTHAKRHAQPKKSRETQEPGQARAQGDNGPGTAGMRTATHAVLRCAGRGWSGGRSSLVKQRSLPYCCRSGEGVEGRCQRPPTAAAVQGRVEN